MDGGTCTCRERESHVDGNRGGGGKESGSERLAEEQSGTVRDG